MKEIYDWVPWFQELARKIAEEDETYLIQKAKNQVERGGDPPLLKYGDEGIDPFSFFYFLASKARDKQPRKRVYNSVSSVFEIESRLPDTDIDDYYIFPTPQSNAHLLFHERENFTPDLLWRLFREAVKDKPNIGSDDFKNALKYIGVPKLTQTLFLINPKYFLPVDDRTYYSVETLGLPPLSEIVNKINKDDGYEEYKSVLKKLKKAFPGCEPYEINMFLYLQKSGEIKVSDNFFQISTNVDNDGKDHWNDFEKNNKVYTNPGHGGYDAAWRDCKPGDIILVRTRMKKGRAIGIVKKNNYDESEGLNVNSRILHVLWINKLERELSQHSMRQQSGFSGTSPKGMYSVFQKTDGYKPSFDLINSLTGNLTKNKSDLDDQQSGADTMTHPLNQILYGPPGTGKTWNAVNRAVAIIDGKSGNDLKEEIRKINEGESLADFERDKIKERFDKLTEEGQIEMVTFHQNFTYEDFIEGIRPVLASDERKDIEYKLHKGVFREIADQAREDSKQNYVLIIDEINRGNIAKIFSELITLIEPSKRIGSKKDETTVTLPYSQDSFGIPDNLYIIGTMNTADRSIAPLDTALRRRFDFIEMMPDSKHVSDNIDDVDCQKLLNAMNDRIRLLLDRERQIGHTYFMNVKRIKGNGEESLAATFKNKIIPLLQEYFYDNWEKIDLVLNCNGFIDKTSIDSNLFKNSDLIDEERKIYELLPDDDGKWEDPNSYQAIYEKGQGETSEAG
ncbi:MAG: AAA domain-containing protein [Gemmatimonadetes bacterium]|nr:AAA domain-containing protein [Gemmatimonadota bacterium]